MIPSGMSTQYSAASLTEALSHKRIEPAGITIRPRGLRRRAGGLLDARERAPTAVHVLEIDGQRIANNIRKSFRSAVVAAGLDPAQITPNTLRHTGASWMAHAGATMKAVADFLGHSTTRMVEMHYFHQDPNYQKGLIATRRGCDFGSRCTAISPHQKDKGSAAMPPTP
jgi:hypothetical protein